MEIKKDIQQQFGRNAQFYVNSQIHKEGKDLQILLEFAQLTGKELVLDIATGGGHTANAFAPFAKSVTALDLTEEMLQVAKNFIKENGNNNIQFIQGDAENLPFQDGLFDIVTCRIAPHHFPNVKKFIEESYRVLKPGGQLLLDDNVCPESDDFDFFYNKIEKMRDYSHFRAWKKTEWIRMIEISGFEIHETKHFTKTFNFESWCERMKLPTEDKGQLSAYMLNASQSIKNKFNIQIENNHIISFQGEALLLKAKR